MFTNDIIDISSAIDRYFNSFNEEIDRIASSILGTESISASRVEYSTISSVPSIDDVNVDARMSKNAAKFADNWGCSMINNRINVIQNVWRKMRDTFGMDEVQQMRFVVHTTMPSSTSSFVSMPVSYENDIGAYRFNGVTKRVADTFNSYILGFVSHISGKEIDPETKYRVWMTLSNMIYMDGYKAYMEIEINGVLLAVYKEKGKEYLTYEVYTKPKYEVLK